jgi:glutamate-1-semialdehyde 2,1-aminomutase
VIIEPLPANFGLLPLEVKFLEKLRSITSKYKALLIFDEVISGFRISLGGMAEITNITPDIITYGKVIGGGFPVGAFGGRADIMDQIAPIGNVYQAGTLSANPISMRAGLATLKKAAKTGQYDALNKTALKFANELRILIKKANQNIEVVQVGSLLWLCPNGQGLSIKSPDDFPKNIQEGFKPLFLALLKTGIYLAPNGYEVMFLSHAHNDEILKKALLKFDNALASLS